MHSMLAYEFVSQYFPGNRKPESGKPGSQGWQRHSAPLTTVLTQRRLKDTFSLQMEKSYVLKAPAIQASLSVDLTSREEMKRISGVRYFRDQSSRSTLP